MRIALAIRARTPMVVLLTQEEERAVALVAAGAAAEGREVVSWTATRSFADGGGSNAEDALLYLERKLRAGEPPVGCVIVLRDVSLSLGRKPHAAAIRALYDVAIQAERTGTVLVFLEVELGALTHVEKELEILEVPLPDFDELRMALHEEVPAAPSSQEDLLHTQQEQLVRAAAGLTQSQARRAFRRVLAANAASQPEGVAMLVEEKKRVLKTALALELLDPRVTLDAVGGMSELKRWLRERARAWSEEARKFSLPPPRGLFLVGVQGCGKSLAAKATAAHFGLPLLRLDFAALFSGDRRTEGSLRAAMRVSEALAPAVLWIDEIEKGFAGGDGRDPVAARALGAFVTWLQEKAAPVFVVATANDVRTLPPELLRKGRFDEIFFVDIPNVDERESILKIHITRFGRNAAKLNVRGAAVRAVDFTGAELEQVVVDGLYEAFAAGRDLDKKDLEHAIARTVPLARTYDDAIKALREWGKDHTRGASEDTSLAQLFRAATDTTVNS